MKRTHFDPVARSFCETWGIGPTQFNRLCEKAGRAAQLQLDDNAAHDDGFNEYAAGLGFSVMWPGLYPLVTKNGRSGTISEDGVA